ncbi:MAG TPA: hypothetical protein VKI17_10500, partial [Gemmataceae bacterium]|nr:hypothetical protein [Gemmataceae bacterium]
GFYDLEKFLGRRVEHQHHAVLDEVERAAVIAAGEASSLVFEHSGHLPRLNPFCSLMGKIGRREPPSNPRGV